MLKAAQHRRFDPRPAFLFLCKNTAMNRLSPDGSLPAGNAVQYPQPPARPVTSPPAPHFPASARKRYPTSPSVTSLRIPDCARNPASQPCEYGNAVRAAIQCCSILRCSVPSRVTAQDHANPVRSAAKKALPSLLFPYLSGGKTDGYY